MREARRKRWVDRTAATKEFEKRNVGGGVAMVPSGDQVCCGIESMGEDLIIHSDHWACGTLDVDPCDTTRLWRETWVV